MSLKKAQPQFQQSHCLCVATPVLGIVSGFDDFFRRAGLSLARMAMQSHWLMGEDRPCWFDMEPSIRNNWSRLQRWSKDMDVICDGSMMQTDVCNLQNCITRDVCIWRRLAVRNGAIPEQIVVRSNGGGAKVVGCLRILARKLVDTTEHLSTMQQRSPLLAPHDCFQGCPA